MSKIIGVTVGTPTSPAKMAKELNITDLQKRITEIDGVVTLPPMVNGAIFVENGKLVYNPNYLAVCTPENKFLHLYQGDTVHLRNTEDYFCNVVYQSNGVYVQHGGDFKDWVDFVAPFEGDYAITLGGYLSEDGAPSFDDPQSQIAITRCDSLVKECDSIFVASDTLTWDGNTEGRAVVEYVGWGALHRQVHVSDVVLTRDDFSDEGCYQTEVNAAGKSHTLHFKKEQCYANGEYLTIGNIISVFPEGVGVEREGDDGTKYHYPKPGIYFYKEDWEVRSLTIPGYDGFKKLDTNLLPECVATKEYVDSAVGDIESALDSIIAIQNSLIGGDGV